MTAEEGMEPMPPLDTEEGPPDEPDEPVVGADDDDDPTVEDVDVEGLE